MKDSPTKTICFFNSNKAWGGGEKWHFTTAREFQHRGFKTFLVTNMNSDLAKKAQKERIPYIPFNVGNLSFLNPIKILVTAMLLRSKKVDTIVMNLPSDLKLAGIAAKIAGVRNIIYRRGMPHPLRNTWLNRFLFKNILTHVIVNSEEIGRSLAQGNESWFPKEKMVLIYNGVDTKLPLIKNKKVYVKKDQEVVIGNAARLTEQKGQKYLIEMAKILKEKNFNFKLIIAGDGELKGQLQGLINEHNLQDEVELLGHIDDMPAFMNSIDIFVFPSLFEGSANTLIETLHHGIPSIAFDISSNPEIIYHGKNGFLAKPFEASELAKYVMDFVGSEEMRGQLVRNGEELVKEKFDSRRNLDKLERIVKC